MRMTADDFWGMSLSEFLLAVEGFSEFNSGGEKPPLSRNELNDLMERFPD